MIPCKKDLDIINRGRQSIEGEEVGLKQFTRPTQFLS